MVDNLLPEDFDESHKSFKVLRHVDKENLNTLSRKDELFSKALKIVYDLDYVSVALLQRKFSIGEQRSLYLMDLMEEAGIINRNVEG